MKMPIRRICAIAAGAVVLAASTAGPAAAESRGQQATTSDGVWKAYGLYDDENNQICSRAYNSVNAARSVVWVTWSGGQTTNVLDAGGDEVRNCLPFSNLDGRGPGRINVQFISSTGAVTAYAFKDIDAL